MRLIDADYLIETIRAYGVRGSGWSDNERENDVCGMIDDTPTIEPNAKRGKWIQCDIGSNLCGVCTECNYPISWWYKSNFCPNCGADMRTEAHHE